MESLLQVTEIFPASCNAVSKQATLKHNKYTYVSGSPFTFMAHPFIYATANDMCPTQL